MAEISERGRARALIAAWKLRAEAAESRLAAVRALCDADNPYLGHQECLLVADVRAVLAAVDGPADHRPDDERFECVTCGDCWPCSAAADPPADHIAIFDGPPMRAAVDGPAEDCGYCREAGRRHGSGAGSTQDGDDDAR